MSRRLASDNLFVGTRFIASVRDLSCETHSYLMKEHNLHNFAQ